MRVPGRQRDTWWRHRGLAMIEFALVLPLFLLLVFGAVAFGTAILDKVVLTNASREAARQGAVYRGTGLRPSATQVRTVATTYCSQNLIAFGGSKVCTVTLSADPATLVTGGTLTVTVTYPFAFLGLTGLLNPFGANNGLTLTASTTMRAE
ncbi:MAG: pilus assembly protein [Rhodocyclaceae bacterium]|nr:pilus assembly protein [Rhodocyclaceae bacterium]